MKAQAPKENESEWIEIYSEKHGKNFWKNMITGEKTWKTPIIVKVIIKLYGK